MTVFGQRKMIYIALALRERKLSKKKLRKEMQQEGLKQLKVETEAIISKQRSSNAAPKKGSGSRLEVEAELRKIEKEVAKKRAKTRNMSRRLMEREAQVEASHEKATELRTVNTLLFRENLRQENLVNYLTSCFLD